MKEELPSAVTEKNSPKTETNKKTLEQMNEQELWEEKEKTEGKYIQTAQKLDHTLDNLPNNTLRTEIKEEYRHIAGEIFQETKALENLEWPESKTKAKKLEKEIQKNLNKLEPNNFFAMVLQLFAPILKNFGIDVSKITGEKKELSRNIMDNRTNEAESPVNEKGEIECKKKGKFFEFIQHGRKYFCVKNTSFDEHFILHPSDGNLKDICLNIDKKSYVFWENIFWGYGAINTKSPHFQENIRHIWNFLKKNSPEIYKTFEQRVSTKNMWNSTNIGEAYFSSLILNCIAQVERDNSPENLEDVRSTINISTKKCAKTDFWKIKTQDSQVYKNHLSQQLIWLIKNNIL